MYDKCMYVRTIVRTHAQIHTCKYICMYECTWSIVVINRTLVVLGFFFLHISIYLSTYLSTYLSFFFKTNIIKLLPLASNSVRIILF